MTEEQKVPIRAVLTSALHNVKLVQDQLESLVNPEDKSFKDFPMTQAVKEVKEAYNSIQEALDTLNG